MRRGCLFAAKVGGAGRLDDVGSEKKNSVKLQPGKTKSEESGGSD